MPARVSVVDVGNKSVAKVLAIPADRRVLRETQNSGQGVFNLLSTVALMPDGALPRWRTRRLGRRHAGEHDLC